MKLIRLQKTSLQLFIFVGILFPLQSIGQGQCLSGGCTGGSNYPTGTFTSTTNSWSTVSTLIYAGEYATYSVTSGSTYEWSLLSADGGYSNYDSQLTLLNGNGSVIYCFSDDYSGLIPKIQWTATFSGSVRVLVSAYVSGFGNCQTNTSATTLVWRCSSCGSGSAPVNDNCSGASTVAVTANCSSPTNGTVAGATNSLITGCFGTSEDDVWYKFTTGAAGNYTISVVGSSGFDAVIELRSGTCNGSSITCVDNTFTGETEVINASLAAATTYYVRVYDYYSSTPSTQTFTICVTNPAYCVPFYSSGTSANDLINRVQLGTLDNTPSGTGSSSGPSYTDYYSSVSAPNIQAGTTQDLTVTVGLYGAQTVAAWIDYNSNNLFEGSEKLGEVVNIAASTTGTISFTIPVGTTSGNKRMRIRTVWSETTLDPCATYSYGEAEDYKVNITPACTTPGTPASLNTTAINTTGATLNWATGTPAGSATVTYYWALGTTSGVTYDAGYLQRGTTTSLNSGALSGLANGTTYYWTVKAKTSCDNTESAYAGSISFTTTCTTPGTPGSLATSGISTTSATFSWSSGSPAGSPTVSYYWAVGTGSGVTYDAGYTDRGITTSLTATSFSLYANTNYYWTVKAVTSCNSASSSYPIAVSFTTLAVATPLIVWDGSTNSDWNTVTNWTPEQIPTISDNVIIPSGCPNYPVITTEGLSINNSSALKKCKSLHISAGGRVTLDESTGLYVYCSGELNISGVFNEQCGNYSDRFQINSGGVVKVKNGGYLNIGSSALSGVTSGNPSGTINAYNDIQINAGQLIVEPGGTLYIQDELRLISSASSIFRQEGGITSIALSGQGSTTRDKLSVAASATFKMLDGIFRVSGDGDDTTKTYDAMWFSFSSNVDIQGGTIELLNGTTAKNFTLTLGNPNASAALNNLIINKPGKAVYLDAISNPLHINGDLTITSGTLNATNGALTPISYNITSAGSITNNGTFTAGSGTLTLTGTNKQILGSSQTVFNNLVLNTGASYTLNPSNATVPQITLNGNLTINSNATLTLASSKIINLAGANNTISGTFTAVDNLDGTRDIGFNNAAGTLNCTGNINADIQISSGTTTLASDMLLNGDFFANTGTFDMGAQTMTVNGSWTNNGSLTEGTGTVILAGNGKNITGTSATDAATEFNNLTIAANASYTFNPTLDNWDINGSFINYGTLNISSGKFIDLYASTAAGKSIIFDGIINADRYNGIKDIDINNTVAISGNGTTNADLRIYSNTTTLTSNFTLGGDFEIRSGATFTMTSHIYNISGSWLTLGTFNSGTGTVRFFGSGHRTVRANGRYNGLALTTSDFYNVTIDKTNNAGDTLSMRDTPMRINNGLYIKKGVFSTGYGTDHSGDNGGNHRLTVEKITNIDSLGTLFVGWRKDVGYTSEAVSVPDSLNIPVFKGDFILKGWVKTNRPVKSGYSDFKVTGARVTGEYDVDEFGVDIQPEDNTTAEQVGPIYIQGDLIIQNPVNNRWRCATADTLYIGGSLYIYGNFEHNGVVTVNRNMTSAANPTETVSIESSTFNFLMEGTNRYIYLDKNPIAFGTVYFLSGSGIRDLRQNITVKKDLTIVSGTLDVNNSGIGNGTTGSGIATYGSSNSSITLYNTNSSWYNHGTFVPRTGTVYFTGNGQQTMGGSNNTTFYNLSVDKANSSELGFAKNGTVTNDLALTNGYILTTPSKLLIISDNATVTPSGGKATSFVRGPVKKIGNDAFIYPVGKKFRWARIGISAPTSTGTEFTGEYFDQGYSNTTSLLSPLYRVSTSEYWLLDRSGTASNAIVTLYWEDAASSGIQSCAPGGDLVVARFDGTNWEDRTNNGGITGSCVGNASGTITSNTVTSFSPFTFGSKTASNSLPIDLLSFNAKLRDSVVDVFWSTASELNSDYFTVERSSDGINFTPILTQNAAGTSNSTKFYTDIDTNPLPNMSYYRLKETDMDGEFQYSEIVPVYYHINLFNSAQNTYINIFPNPANDFITVVFDATGQQNYSLVVFDIVGKLVYSKQIHSPDSGLVNEQIDVKNFKSGIYFLQIISTNNKIQSKFIKTE